MIGTIDVKCQAARPNMPLTPIFAFKNSPSSLRVLDVPKCIGTWNIHAVKVVVNYPDNQTTIKNAVRNGSVWVATFDGCAVVGKVGNGYQIVADGVDENGNDVTGYVLGVGDVYIIDCDENIEDALLKYTVRYCDTTPTNPVAGDIVVETGTLKFYDGTQWISIDTDLQEYATKEELNQTKGELEDAIDTVQASIPTNVSQLNNDTGYITASALPTNVSDLTNDVGYITSTQVEPASGLSYEGYAEKSKWSNYLGAIETTTSRLTDKAYLAGLLKTNAQTNELELDYTAVIIGKYPWYLTQLFGTEYSPYVKLNWGIASIHRQRGGRWTVIKNKQWMWVAESQFAITTDSEGNPDGNFYVLHYGDATHPNAINDPATDVHTITIESGAGVQIHVATIDGQTGQIDCYSSTTNYPISERKLAYRDELPTKVSDLTNDAGYLTTVSWSDVQNKPSNVSDFNNDAGYITASAIPTNLSDFTNDVGYLSAVYWNDIQSRPSNVSDFVNDVGYITASAIPSNVSDFNNDAGYVTASTVSASYYNKTETDALLSAKQDALTTPQMSAINSVVDERKTVVTYTDNTTATFDIYGTLNHDDIYIYGNVVPAKVKIGNGVTTIGVQCFQGNSSLTSIEIPDSVTSINSGAFTGTGLATVEIPASVKTLQPAFTHNANLTSIVLNEGLETIDGSGVLAQCNGLTTLTIPASVTSIAANAFTYLTNISSVVFREKTLAQVQAMANYPWGISDTSIIKTWNVASKEYVDEQIAQIMALIQTYHPSQQA